MYVFWPNVPVFHLLQQLFKAILGFRRDLVVFNLRLRQQKVAEDLVFIDAECLPDNSCYVVFDYLFIIISVHFLPPEFLPQGRRGFAGFGVDFLVFRFSILL